MPESLRPRVEFSVGSPLRQFRFAPIQTGSAGGFLAVHANCAGVDPYHRMFFLPTDTLKLTAFAATGERLWQRDLGPGMIPGTWFCPVVPFDLDGNGTDDVWVVSNSDPDHPMDFECFVLERMSAADGTVMQVYPWPAAAAGQDMSHSYRNFIHAGFSRGQRRQNRPAPGPRHEHQRGEEGSKRASPGEPIPALRSRDSRGHRSSSRCRRPSQLLPKGP